MVRKTGDRLCSSCGADAAKTRNRARNINMVVPNFKRSSRRERAITGTSPYQASPVECTQRYWRRGCRILDERLG